jgi:Predicted transcriptional regulators
MATKPRILVAFGKRVRELREAEGWSQEEFAARIGMDRSFYSAVERGERNVSLLRIKDIADGLGVAVGDLFAPGGR